jgi:hypothetical protein
MGNNRRAASCLSRQRPIRWMEPKHTARIETCIHSSLCRLHDSVSSAEVVQSGAQKGAIRHGVLRAGTRPNEIYQCRDGAAWTDRHAETVGGAEPGEESGNPATRLSGVEGAPQGSRRWDSGCHVARRDMAV